jgi:predicted MPP superfamily phosphohydrolase
MLSVNSFSDMVKDIDFPRDMAKHKFEHNNHANGIFLLVSVILQALISWFSYIIYETWVAAFGPGWQPLEIIFFVFSFTFISATLLAIRYRSWPVRAYYWFAARWFACMGPLFGGSALFVVIENLGPYVGLFVVPWLAGIISFSVAIAFIFYGFWQAQRAMMTRVAVSLPNLPDPWIGKTIVFVSDLHLGDVFGVRFARKVVGRISALAPEAVLVGGDLYDGLRCDAPKLIAPFKTLAALYDIYFVTGNHDYLGKSEEYIAAIRNAGINVLKNEVVDLRGMQLAGVDYNDAHHKDGFERALKNISIDDSKPSIFLKHVPDNLDVSAAHGFSLQLSGHTHRGQFWPLSFITRRLFNGYDYGLKPLGAMQVYTSSGVGAWGMPFRLGTKSEIVAITLKKLG